MDALTPEIEEWYNNFLRIRRPRPGTIEPARDSNLLHKAIFARSDLPYSLLKVHPNIAELANEKDSMGRTPVHLAIERGLWPLAIKILSAKGVDPNIKDSNGYTPYILAMRLLNTSDGDTPEVRRTRENNLKEIARLSGVTEKKQQARDLAAAEQTILRAPGQLGRDGLAAPGSAMAKAMESGILQSQVGKFLTSKPVKGESVKPAIRELRRDVTGRGRRKRFSTRRKNKRNVATRTRYPRRRA